MHAHKETLHGHLSSFMQICTQQVWHVLTFELLLYTHKADGLREDESEIN